MTPLRSAALFPTVLSVTSPSLLLGAAYLLLYATVAWLLIRRAVSEGELTPEQAVEEQRKIKLPVSCGDQPARELGMLPQRLRELIEQSVKLQERVIRLDHMLDYNQLPVEGEADHPLEMQLSRLRAAFGPEAE